MENKHQERILKISLQPTGVETLHSVLFCHRREKVFLVLVNHMRA